ncbi:MAG TPA: NHL repeat-containing protein, partial [Planctomycetaceae bacterium]|nr:NHL repeat-containing protein [Planctomycetaceae bacterium]
RASFDHPQGLALVGDKLYVADTENHMIREIDLTEKTVRTIAGTGKQGHDRRLGGEPSKTALNSPWDLVHVSGKLYIAMAGPHQLWVLDLQQNSIRPYAGSGNEDILNGPFGEAAMAQPSGITTDGKFLYVVDSEGSALRRVPLDEAGSITTIAGASDLAHGRSLFEFGDRDGVGAQARLQHPLGIAWREADGLLYVADSYNHKIKQVDPTKEEVQTFLGDGRPGDRDDPPRFAEPAGLAIAGQSLFVADTNNNLIRKVDLSSGKVQKFTIEGLAAPVPPKSSDTEEPEAGKTIRVPPQRIAAGDKVSFEVALSIPQGYKLNKLAPPSFRMTAAGQQSLFADDLRQRREIAAPEEGTVVKFDVPLAGKSGKADLKLTVSYDYCRDGEGGLCKLGKLTWSIPLEVAADAKVSSIRLSAAKE